MFQPQSQMLAAVAKALGEDVCFLPAGVQCPEAEEPELKQMGRHRASPSQLSALTSSSTCYWKEGAKGRSPPGLQEQGSLPALWCWEDTKVLVQF